MDGPRDCHTEWSNSDRQREISYDIGFFFQNKKIRMNLFTKQEQTHRLKEQTYGYQGIWLEGKSRLGVWDWHVHTAIFKIDNQQGPTIKINK